MEIKKKLITRSGWLRILERRFALSEFKYPSLSGVAALMELKKVREPLIAEFRGETLKIVDDGYFWLQIAPRGENFWITVMLDEGGNILQYYFDITEKNVIDGESSHFYDLFLDLVTMPDVRLITLDGDELEEALSEGVINEAQYNKAWRVLSELKEAIPSRSKELEVFCKGLFERLKEKMNTD
ncbi:MAG: DUF402 domain-containing protein [Ruminococcaceae bacterium]|nr:DUF402 domain-containing protein [Oscillospiraceae bacterium]